MAFRRLLTELRYPTTRRGKVLVVILSVLVFTFLCLGAVAGFLLSSLLLRPAASESIDPTAFLANVQSLEFRGPDGRPRSGWFFPGMREGPVIVICHGYGSSRAEILTLATSLQQHRYNVFAFNFAGHGESPVSYTTLGLKETEELLAALRMLARRDDIDADRIGLWGYSLGAYVALQAATRSPRVKAVVLDSIYPTPTRLLRLELHRAGVRGVPLIGSLTVLEFRFLTLFSSGQNSATEAAQKTAGLPKLFVTGGDTPRLAELTRQVYEEAPGPKDLRELSRTNIAALSEDVRREYENLVVGFFLRNLPLAS